MSVSAIILAGGSSSRFGQNKGLLKLADKPLIGHILDRISNIADEKLVVVSSKTQVEQYLKIAGPGVKILLDAIDVRSPLTGAMTGFEKATWEYSILLPCDTPLVSKDVISLLVDLCMERNAVVPRWPSGHIEPLQAVYRTEPALEAARNASCAGEKKVQAMVDRLRYVRYVSTLILEQLDPGLRTFLNVNAPIDLRKLSAFFGRNSSLSDTGRLLY